MKTLIFLIALAITSPTWAQLPRMMVIAHRGNHVWYPENSIEAFESAIRAGVDYIEVDLRETSDGRLVVFHDSNLNRMTGLNKELHQSTLAELNQLKLIARPELADSSFHIPTFIEVLKLAKNKVGIYLDFKSANVEKAWAEIQHESMETHVVVYINHPAQYNDWRKVAPQIPLMISPEKKNGLDSFKSFLKKNHYEILDGNVEDYSPEFVDLAHKYGREVWVDVQRPNESQREWDLAIKLKVDAIQTDFPEKLLAYLKSIGLHN